jgi:hypothetical protein
VFDPSVGDTTRVRETTTTVFAQLQQAASAPGEQDLAAIRAFALAHIAPEDLYIRRMVVANDAVDRNWEQFTPAVLEHLAATLPGKALLVAHDKRPLPVGLVYRAAARPAQPGEAGQTSLEAWFYLVKTSANEDLRRQIDAGVVRYVSIGCTYDQRLCNICDSDYWDCAHWRGQTLPDGRVVTLRYGGDPRRYEAHEVSLVYLGAQREAQLAKAAGSGDPMELDKLVSVVSALQQSVAGLVERVEKALTPAPSPAVDEKPSEASDVLSKDGEAYRVDLRAEIGKLAELAKCGPEARLLLAAMPTAPASALKEIRDSYQQKVDQLFPPSPHASVAKVVTDTAADEPEAPAGPPVHLG